MRVVQHERAAFWLPVVLTVAQGGVAVASLAAEPFDRFFVLVAILVLNAFLVHGPRLVRPDDPSHTRRARSRVSVRLVTAVTLVSAGLYPWDTTRPVAAGLTLLFGVFVAALMVRSEDPWSVPQRPPERPPWARDR